MYALTVRDAGVRAAVEAAWTAHSGSSESIVPLLLHAEPDDPEAGGVRVLAGPDVFMV